MTAEIITLFALLIGVILWGAHYYLWHRAHKSEVEMSQARRERLHALTCREDIHYIYSVRPHNEAYYVVMFDWVVGNIPIKRFYDEDKGYARRCAEELCDMLNERI